MVVCREIERRVVRIYGAGQRAVARIDVLIELLVVGEERAVLDGQSILEVVLDEAHDGMDVGVRDVQGGAAEERRDVAARRERGRRIGPHHRCIDCGGRRRQRQAHGE